MNGPAMDERITPGRIPPDRAGTGTATADQAGPGRAEDGRGAAAGSAGRRAGGVLRRLIAAGRPAVPEAREEPARCELCGAEIPEDVLGHRHLLDLRSRELRCACRPCGLLFDHPAAGGGRYRLVPEHRRHLDGFALDEADWAGLAVPVRMAFFRRDSAAGRVTLHYPSPGGAVEAPLDQAFWARLAAANPVLAELAEDVEALLVDRTGETADHWLVPVDDCYALVGLIRTHWKGLAGGAEVWTELGRFFAGLRRRSTTVAATRVKGEPR